MILKLADLATQLTPKWPSPHICTQKIPTSILIKNVVVELFLKLPKRAEARNTIMPPSKHNPQMRHTRFHKSKRHLTSQAIQIRMTDASAHGMVWMLEGLLSVRILVLFLLSLA